MGKLHGHNEGETERLNRGGDRRKRERGLEAKESNWNIGIEHGRREGQKCRSNGLSLNLTLGSKLTGCFGGAVLAEEGISCVL